MRINANAVLRSWTLLAAFGGSYMLLCLLIHSLDHVWSRPPICKREHAIVEGYIEKGVWPYTSGTILGLPVNISA